MESPSKSSGLVAASTAIMARSGRLTGLLALADGTNAATIILYDNATAASGTVLAKIVVKATDTFETAHIPDAGIDCLNGVYAALSGTGAACVVYFQAA